MNNKSLKIIPQNSVKVGDFIALSLYKVNNVTIHADNLIEVQLNTFGSLLLDGDEVVLRELNNDENPKVLRLALEKLHRMAAPVMGGTDSIGTLEEIIEQARQKILS